MERDSYPAGECLAALGAHEGGGHEVGVVVPAEVHVQQLFLPEGLLTVAAGVRLLAGVGALVHDHVSFLLAKKIKKCFYSLSGTQGCNKVDSIARLSNYL